MSAADHGTPPAPPDATGAPSRLALDLAVTLRHDGRGGVADRLADPADLAEWLADHARELRAAGYDPGPARSDPGPLGAAGCAADAVDAVDTEDTEEAADAAMLAAVVEVRTAVRALFARAVAPAPPSRADAGRLPDARTALDRLNAAAARVPLAPRLDWPEGAPPTARDLPAGAPGRAEQVAAALARAAIAFLAGPDRERLRACSAPRCVRYFVQGRPRQSWCSPACGNRARVARHQARHSPAG